MQKILIVEDDIDIQDILKNHLIDAGYEVAVASDGVAGIAMFDDTIDLLLLDIMYLKQTENREQNIRRLILQSFFGYK